MINSKSKKIYLINLAQLLIQISFFIWGICFEAKQSGIISSNLLEMLTKVQTTNSLQNFLWCFTNNLSVLFIVFWLNYWTFGVIGTLWCANSAFSMGSLIKMSFLIKSWLSICFISLEVISASIILLSSTYFRFNKFMIKKRAKERERKMYEDLETEEAIEAIIEINEEKTKKTSKREQKKQEKNILKTMAIIFLIVLVAAILETIALNFINSI